MANIEWGKLGFAYMKTNTIVKMYYQNGQWGPVISSADDNITINSYAASLHYGVECFEGLKAFRGKNGEIRIFRPDENAKRMQRSAEYLGIAAPSVEQFIEMVKQVVLENQEFIPPYGSGASLYIRPTLIGYGPQLGVKSPEDALFMIMVSPVGAYAGSINEPVKTVIAREYDRAAPNGSGSYKVGGNYAMSLKAGKEAAKEGYKGVLYLDPKEHKYIDEFSSSNFFAIKGNTYVTVDSNTVLPSITNKSLEQVAKDLGMEVERRKVPVEELAQFDEVGECGTAVVITPVGIVDDKPTICGQECKRYTFGDPTKCGEKSLKLYKQILAIQHGEVEDTHNWCIVL